ncbi:hypothetical protein COLO4_15446 [Corchorus olitorius]|uniref:Uncharacterized protein n=1 Tax=Corchorus olitorius TaxID=93759 RepID=A0A1R3JMR2_9ROSI|nr:hypothetical protein COLO4_15446 [Corchorus olitorius]
MEPCSRLLLPPSKPRAPVPARSYQNRRQPQLLMSGFLIFPEVAP